MMFRVDIAVRALLLCVFSFLTAACDNRSSSFGGVGGIVDGANGTLFFNVEAEYRVKRTGEVIAFDYVGICAGSIKRWGDDEPRERRTNYPDLMIMPTQDGAAVGVRTPAMCYSSRWGISGATGDALPPDQFFIPEDYLPSTFWYPNINDLGMAFFYASDVAYESPYSKLEFLGASIKRSDYEAWKDWRQRAVEAYEPIEGFPGPWGFNLNGRDVQDLEARVRDHNNGAGIIGANCTLFMKLEIPEQFHDLLSKYRSDDAGRYWISDKEVDGEYLRQALSKTSGSVFNHGRFRDHFFDYGASGEDGVRTSSGKLYEPPGYRKAFYYGGGRFNRGNLQGNFYHDVYPAIRFAGDSRKPDGTVHQISQLLISDEWRGFGLCYSRTELSREALEAYALNDTPLFWEHALKGKIEPEDDGTDFYVNDELVQSSPGLHYYPFHALVEDNIDDIPGKKFVYLYQAR